jgi:hypothetical protein
MPSYHTATSWVYKVSICIIMCLQQTRVYFSYQCRGNSKTFPPDGERSVFAYNRSSITLLSLRGESSAVKPDSQRAWQVWSSDLLPNIALTRFS